MNIVKWHVTGKGYDSDTYGVKVYMYTLLMLNLLTMQQQTLLLSQQVLCILMWLLSSLALAVAEKHDHELKNFKKSTGDEMINKRYILFCYK